MSKILIVQIEHELEKLEKDHNYRLDKNEVKGFLGRYASEYFYELSRWEAENPKKIDHPYCLDLARKGEELLHEVQFALNAGHISIDTEQNGDQKARMRAFHDRAAGLLAQFKSATTYDPDFPNQVPPCASYFDRFVSYHDDGPDSPYADAYAALESHPVFVVVKKEDYHINREMRPNKLQERYLRLVLDEMKEAENPIEATANPTESLRDKMRKFDQWN